jgi:hypothetical protein
MPQYFPQDFRLPLVKSKKIEEKPPMTDVNGRSIMIAAAAFSDQRVRSENRAELLNSGNSFQSKLMKMLLKDGPRN